MQSYLSKKWTWITPLHTSWNPPAINEGYTIDVERSFTRLVRANAFHIDYNDKIDMTSDIYVLVQFDIGNFEKEVEFAKKIKSMGKKFILCYSADLRFLLGNQFISQTGLLYTELCKYADVILSGTGKDINIYGRYGNKVLSWGLPMERLNFSTKQYQEKEYDILISGMQGGECFAYELEFMCMLKDRYPDIKIIHSSQEWHREYMGKMKQLYPFIDFVHEPLIKNLTNSKVYINLEIRPRGGRALLDAWMCRTPFISCESTFYSQIFPKYSYSMKFNFDSILDIYSTLKYDLETIPEIVNKTAEENAEPLYFDNMIPILMGKLYS